jgi:ribosome recycling factor
MIEDIRKDATARMQKSVDALRQELKHLRTGRAHTSLLDHIRVDYYGAQMPLSQCANLAVADPHTLTVAPWDKSMVQAIEKAILASDLGLNPVTAGTVIRVPLPPLTEERRRELIKVVKHEAEHARVAVRNVRRDAIHHLKELLKDKKVTEDQERRAQDEMQKLTDKFVAEVDRVLGEKETELMEV